MNQTTVAAATASAVGVSADSPGSTPAAKDAPSWPPSPDHLTLPIWPGPPPGAKTNLPPETATNAAGSNTIAGMPCILLGNVSSPAITLYKPKGKDTEATIVVFPGVDTRLLPSTWRAPRLATGSTRSA